MKTRITQALIDRPVIGTQRIYINDSIEPSLWLVEIPSRIPDKPGAKSFYVQYARAVKDRLGEARLFTPTQARNAATEWLREYRKTGTRSGQEIKRAAKAAPATEYTLQDYLTDSYEPWLHLHQRSAAESLATIKAHFGSYLKQPATAITVERVQAWTQAALATRKPSTVRRILIDLQQLLTRAAKDGVMPARVKLQFPKEPNANRVRYLAPDEEQRLRAALRDRNERLKAARFSHNAWLEKRHQPPLPELVDFADYLEPLVRVALNSGLRRGELLQLEWAAVDFDAGHIEVVGHTAKSYKSRHVPMNAEAREVLRTWRKQSSGKLVFTCDGEPIQSIKTAWSNLLEKAQIENFRFHDCRHHFASRLVQRGAALEVVRELLGHSDFATTLKYSHHAGDAKARAVALLGADV